MSITLNPGYHWGPKLTKPAKVILNIINHWPEQFTLAAGLHDIVTIPVGDNRQIADENLCKYKTINLAKRSGIAIMPVFDLDEPSCGFLICRRGPYAEGTPENQRGQWLLNGLPDGLVAGRIAIPVYTHSGARHSRYGWNGFPWLGNGHFQPISNTNYWGRSPVGPKKFWSTQRVAIQPSKYAPDVTRTFSVESGSYFISYSKVDMFGRETELSEPLQVNITNSNSYFVVRRNSDVEMGTSGFYVYIGKTADDMHRQPILNADGVTPRYLWPVSHQQFVIQSFTETGIRAVAPPSYGIASILNQPQKNVVDGKLYINYGKESYDLYCPFILSYVVQQFGRKLGLDGKRCRFNHKEKYGNAQLMSDIPLVVISNQKDEIANAIFTSNSANTVCGVTFSDWGGGQAFSPAITNCSFQLYGQDGVGFLVEDVASSWWGNHTASEVRVKNTQFICTIPIKIEGNQSAKIRFTDMCQLWATGQTKYKGDTACIYACCPNDIDVENPEGIGGAFRSIVCTAAYSGSASVTLTNFFIDTGCPVYATFCSYNGGKIVMADGERINSHSQGWARMAEAPSTLRAYMRMNDVRVNPSTTAINFNLNQLALDLDVPLNEVVSPTVETWLASGMSLEYPGPGATGNNAYFNFGAKPSYKFSFGQDNIPDNLTHNPNPIAISGQPNVSKDARSGPDHWAFKLLTKE